MIHLRSVAIRDEDKTRDEFPFNVPVIQSLEEMLFSQPVTFFVGENGSGKSTLLEAIAAAAQLPTVGSTSTANDPTLEPIRRLSKRLRWAWNKRTRRGFFMRSEDFFGFVKRIQTEASDLQATLADDNPSHAGQSDFARQLAKMPAARELSALRDSYGDGLDTQSHGESYLKLFQARFVPNGLYLLDEPEAPLSPMRQLGFLSVLHEMVQQNAQFIIATHSPIVLAYPGATIYNFINGRIVDTPYDDLEHVTLTRDFLQHPNAYLRHLLS